MGTRPLMTAREIAEAIAAYYQKPGNGAGGVLHIAIDDGNVTNADLDFCEFKARAVGDTDALDILDALRERSRSRRKSIVRWR